MIERQLRWPGMYPQPTNNSPSTTALKPKSISETNSTGKWSTESSPQSSLPCGQRTPTASTSSSNGPSSHTPPQPFVHTQHTSPKPHRQQTQHTPVKTNTNQPTQLHISGEEQCVPKSADGSQVKHSKQQPRQQNGCLCFYCNQEGHLKRDCPEIPYCSRCRTRDTHRANVLANLRGASSHANLENPENNQKGMKIFHNFQTSETCVFIVQETTRQWPVQWHGNSKPQTPIQVPQYIKIHPTHHNCLLPAHTHKPVIHTVNLLCMYRHQPLTLMPPPIPI